MTARERAIEAGLKAAEDDPRWKFDIYPTGWAEVEDIVTIAAPFIESALLDRIEEKVKGLEAPEVWSEPMRHGFGAALKRVSALLSEIREEASAQSGEGQ